MSADHPAPKRRKQRPVYAIDRCELTAHDLRRGLSYDPETGIFRWSSPRPKIKVGTIAGTEQCGYWMIHFSGVDYHAHRLAWLYMTGEWPSGGVDHKNRDRLDNRWANLREANQSQNGANIGLLRSNTSGFKGVSFHKRARKWHAYIKSGRRRIHLGLHETAEDAAAAYDAAAKRIFGDFALTNERLLAGAPS